MLSSSFISPGWICALHNHKFHHNNKPEIRILCWGKLQAKHDWPKLHNVFMSYRPTVANRKRSVQLYILFPVSPYCNRCPGVSINYTWSKWPFLRCCKHSYHNVSCHLDTVCFVTSWKKPDPVCGKQSQMTHHAMFLLKPNPRSQSVVAVLMKPFTLPHMVSQTLFNS